MFNKSIQSVTFFTACLSAFNAFSACNIPKEPKDPFILRDSFDVTLKEGPLTEAGKLTTSQGKVKGVVMTKTVEVNGAVRGNGAFFGLWKGTAPNLIYHANCDSSVDIAWLDPKKSTINITKIDNKGKVLKTFRLPLKQDSLPDKATGLLGFTKTPDGSYAVAYSKPEEHLIPSGENAGKPYYVGHLYLAKFDWMGKHVWTNHIFGENHNERWSLFNPGSSSSGRLEYDSRLDALIYFMGTNRRMGRAHQGSTFGVYSTNGDFLSGNPWMVSHDYDQRIVFDGDHTYLFGHGDGGPYGLYVAKWKFTDTGLNSNGKPTASGENQFRPVSFSKYSTKTRNITNHVMGDVVGLGNDEFAIVYNRGNYHFETRHDRGTYNVFFRRLNTKGNIQDFSLNKQLTDIKVEFENTGVARLAKFDGDLIIGWRNSNKPYAFIGEYDYDGNVIVEPKMIENVKLNSMYGMITLPNGNVFWASSENATGNKMHLNWIKKVQ